MDPRANNPETIVPPAPLPHVSRRALQRVRDYMPPPTICRYCGGPVRLINHREIYGREYSEWPYLYDCRACDAYVGLHPKTDLPLGTLANAELRNARKTHKAKFIALTKKHGWDRKKAYSWLAGKMGIDKSVCHWGWFDADQCLKAGELCEVIDEP